MAHPSDYPSWNGPGGYKEQTERRKSHWEKVGAFKRATGRLPWQVKCDKCEGVAIVCFAADLSKPDTPRVRLCGDCLANGAALSQEAL